MRYSILALLTALAAGTLVEAVPQQRGSVGSSVQLADNGWQYCNCPACQQRRANSYYHTSPQSQWQYGSGGSMQGMSPGNSGYGLPLGRRYYNGRYYGNFNNRFYGPQYGYF